VKNSGIRNLLNLLLVSGFLHISLNLRSQDPERFRSEVDSIQEKYLNLKTKKNLIVFTGSSSIRMWDSLGYYFPGRKLINAGFGGSQMSDLLFYADRLILQYNPSQVVIYEGDNDLFSNENPASIAEEVERLILLINKELPKTRIILLSAKPSPSRWSKRDAYLSLNSLFKQLAEEYKYVRFVDVWTPLISASGRPDASLYLSDSLHINDMGYRLWAPKIRKALKN
jgi:lysophospholipase L1-like esterase